MAAECDRAPSSSSSSSLSSKRSLISKRAHHEHALDDVLAATGGGEKEKSTSQVIGIAWRRAWKGGIPGMIAGAIQVIVLMWLRTVTNYQYRYGTTMMQSMQILYKQGGIGRFYEGISFALIQGPLSRLGSTAANEGMVALMRNLSFTRGFPLIFSTALAASASGLWRIVLLPVDTFKIVLQVEGQEGFKSLMRRVRRGEISALYQGAIATALAAVAGHIPWFTTYNYLNKWLAESTTTFGHLLRNGFIGFVSSVVSDIISNAIRVIKTTKQAAASLSSVSYGQAIQIILAADGWHGLFGRGLGTRILANGVQSILFTVIWNGLKEWSMFKPAAGDDDPRTKVTARRGGAEGKSLLRGATGSMSMEEGQEAQKEKEEQQLYDNEVDEKNSSPGGRERR